MHHVHACCYAAQLLVLKTSTVEISCFRRSFLCANLDSNVFHIHSSNLLSEEVILVQGSCMPRCIDIANA